MSAAARKRAAKRIALKYGKAKSGNAEELKRLKPKGKKG